MSGFSIFLLSNISAFFNLRLSSENNNDEKQSKPQNQEQKTKNKEQEHKEMSIETNVPDLENQAKETDENERELEIEDNTRSDLKKRVNNNFGDLRNKNKPKLKDMNKISEKRPLSTEPAPQLYRYKGLQCPALFRA